MTVRLGHGVSIPSSLDGDRRFWAELHAWGARLPAATAFTGLTAARAYGLWLPPIRSTDRLEVACWGHPIRRPELTVTRHRGPIAWTERMWVRIATVPEAIVACAARESVLDLVVLIDSALHLRLARREQVEAAAAQVRRGVPRLRQALALADARSESPWESLLRVLHVVCGVPVTPQAEIRDGTFVARGDLLITGTRTLQEFDGSGHFERTQYRRDRRRERALNACEYVRNGWTAADVVRDVDSILAAASRATGADYRREPWLRLLADSRFAPRADR